MGDGREELRVLVLGDGANELGREFGRLLSADHLPALPRIVHRLLGEPGNVLYEPGVFRQVEHGRGKGKAFEKKTKAAILLAKHNGHHAVVIVRDRDRSPSAEKVDPIIRKRDSMIRPDLPPCAVGCAIETFDAWMIADGRAVHAAGGDPGKTHRSPESLDGKEGTGRHPKDVAAEVFGSKKGLGDKYAVVAANADLPLLVKTCPQGFKPFADEVRERIGPVVSRE